MDIQCPSCQRKLSIGDQYAGQLVKCPACNGVFSAPSLAPPMAPPMAPPVAPPAPSAPPASSAPFGFSGEAVKPPEVHSAPPPAPPKPPPPAIFDDEPADVPPGSFGTSHTIELCPDVLRWVAPVAISLLFLFSFFAWTAEFRIIPPTAAQLEEFQKASQKAFEENQPQPPAPTATTGLVGHNLWEVSFGERGSGLWITYLLLTLFLAVPLAWVKLLIEMNIIPKLDFLKPFWIWRAVAVGGFFAFILLFALLAWFSFGPGQVSGSGLYLGLLAHVVAIAAFGLEYWLAIRKKAKLPLPELTVKW